MIPGLRIVQILLGALSLLMVACGPDNPAAYPKPTTFVADLPPQGLGFPNLPWPQDNPPTVEGVALGKRLFFDKGLSLDYSISCASCHHSDRAFSDTVVYSQGVGGALGTMNAMPLFNLLWANRFFWDGRSPSLRDQVLQPIQDPIEMHLPLGQALDRLSGDAGYRVAFGKAFGDESITVQRLQWALEQYLLSLTSHRSRFDLSRRGLASLTPSEQRGLDLFMREYSAPGSGRPVGADCFHCHGGGLFTNRTFENNGLDSVLKTGFQIVSGLASDRGKFKTPSLRNVGLTAPYMHDGRFATLEEVVEHYNSGIRSSSTLNANLRVQTGGLRLSSQDKADLVAFLHTLTDTTLAQNPHFVAP